MRTTRKSIEERGSKATAAKKTRAHGHHDSGDEESEEEFTTEEFEVELDDTSAWAMNFYDCASEGDFAFLKQILDDGKVDVNNVDVDGFTALMIAAAEGHKEIVMELLQRGADVAVRTHELCSTALHFAAKVWEKTHDCKDVTLYCTYVTVLWAVEWRR
jgi:ankyrin repeat protein